MSLVEQMMEPCVIVNKVQTSDGESGLSTEWIEGAEIMAAITFDSSMQARIAQKDGVTSVYTITTRKDIQLDYHTVLKRLSDGQYFRTTSNAGDKVSPAASRLNMAQVTAERWELTT